MNEIPHYERIESWREKCKMTQKELCAQSGISERTYRSIISGESRNRTTAVIAAVEQMANILSPENPNAFIQDIYGLGSLQCLIDDIKAALPYATSFADDLAPLFSWDSAPIDCSYIISSFAGLLRSTYNNANANNTVYKFLCEMACELSSCNLETDSRTLEPIWSSLISNITVLCECGLPSEQAIPVLNLLRQSRIKNISNERFFAIRAAFFLLFDNYDSVSSVGEFYTAISDVAVLCVDYKLSSPSTFSLAYTIYDYCMELSANTGVLSYFSARNSSDHNILLCLDEFASLGKLEITDALRKLRKKHVRILILTQNLSDIEDIYGRGAYKSMLSNFKYTVLLGVGEAETQEYFAKLIGREDKHKESSTSAGVLGGQISRTSSTEKDYIIQPADLNRLGDSLILLHPDGYIRLRKAYYYK